MVWARTKLLIWDYVFEPVKDIRIAYSGKTPEKLYRKINELIRVVFNVPEGYIQEKTYKWEKKKDTDKFDVSWEVTKMFDTFTYLVIELNLKGFTTSGEGQATVAIKPRMITEYPQDTIWEQNLAYEMLRRFWHVTFYHHRRMEFLDVSKNMCIAFETSIKHHMEEIRT